MWSDSNSSSSGRGGALQDAAAHQPQAACAVWRFECAVAASRLAAFTYSSMLPWCHMLVVAAFGRCWWLLRVSSGNQRLMLVVPGAGAVGGAIRDAVRTRSASVRALL